MTTIKPNRNGRLTLVAHATTEYRSHEPIHLGVATSVPLIDAEPCLRRVMVPTERAPVQFGWVSKPGLVEIFNVTADTPSKNPTAEEKQKLASQKIYLGLASGPPFAEIPVGLVAFLPIPTVGPIADLYWWATVPDVEARVLATPAIAGD